VQEKKITWESANNNNKKDNVGESATGRRDCANNKYRTAMGGRERTASYNGRGG